LDLSQRKAAGKQVDSRNIKKHKNDVFRLFAIVDPEFAVETPSKIKNDLAVFIDRMAKEEVSLKSLGLLNQTLDGVLKELQRIYGID